jgi:hypothetical protein
VASLACPTVAAPLAQAVQSHISQRRHGGERGHRDDVPRLYGKESRMSQINVNPSSDSGDRTGSSMINMVTVIIVLAVLVLVGWWLVTAGPFSTTGAPRDVNVNINPPTVQQPAQPPAQAPATKP